jgi:hypothetical protein
MMTRNTSSAAVADPIVNDSVIDAPADATPEQNVPEQNAAPEQTADEMRAQIAALTAERDALASKPATEKLPDFTAGKRSVEVIFRMITEALTAGVPAVALSDLYESRAEQLDRNPNTTSKRVARELHALTVAALEAQTAPESE